MEIRRWIFLVLVLVATSVATAQVFDCHAVGGTGGFTSGSGPCQAGPTGGSGAFKVVGSFNGSTPTLTSGSIVFPTGSTHVALSLMYQTAVDIRAFSTTFTFIPNGLNVSFVINNCPNSSPTGCGGFGGAAFSAGASCEGGFYQGFSGNPFPINVFAMMFDSYGYLHASDSTFGGSNVQIYQQNQSPCNPTSGGSQPYWSTTKFSTSPVPLTLSSGTAGGCTSSPGNGCGTSTGDTYSATVTYDGSTLTLNMFDVTASGSCPGASCFTQTWSNVSIPSQVDGTTGYIGMVMSTGGASAYPLEVTGWTYTVNSATASPGSTATSAGSSTAANPTFSPIPGTYSSAQTVTISCATGSSNIAYTLGASGLTLLPLANNLGGTAVGTTYSSPVTISSTNTLYANCGVNNSTNTGYLPSGVVQGLYTIAAGATAPSCTPTSGSSSSPITVICTNSNAGTTIMCYTEDGTTPITNGSGTGCSHGTSLSGSSNNITISSTVTTLDVVAGTSTLADSTVSSYGAYTITPAGGKLSATGVVKFQGKVTIP